MPETNVETLSKKTSEGRPYQREAMANNDTRDESGGFECFNCGYACKTGELSCPNCLTMFSTGGRTRKLADAVTYHQPDQKWPTGDVFLATQQILTFCVDKQQLSLPVQNTLIVGRASGIPGDQEPNVSLDSFDAGANGVSRQHIKITRVRDMMYVTDLGSSNGTFLNGRRLAPNVNRLLRNGDELQLGYLKVRVSFSS